MYRAPFDAAAGADGVQGDDDVSTLDDVEVSTISAAARTATLRRRKKSVFQQIGGGGLLRVWVRVVTAPSKRISCRPCQFPTSEAIDT